MTTGVELEYKNGLKILLGERGTTNSSSFDKKVCSIEIKPTVSDAHGKERKICFYDDAGKQLGKQNRIVNPIFADTDPIKKQIDPDFELIGV